MDETIRKKINLLVHLAKSDGKFHVSEKAFMKDLLEQKGIRNYNIDAVDFDDNPLSSISSIVDKQELIYWCLRLIKADGIVHPDEVAYSKAIAIKLNFNPLLIDKYSSQELPSFEIFKEELKIFNS